MRVLDIARSLLAAPQRRHRRAWANSERASIEVRGLGGLTADGIAREVEDALLRVAGVAWLSSEPVRGRVTVALEGPVELAELVRAVEEAEARAGVAATPFPLLPDHPADLEPLVREGAAALADAAAIGVGIAGQLAHLARLPMEVAGLVPFAQNQPRLRGVVEAVVGPAPSDLGFAVGNALVQALAQGPIGLAADLAHHVNVLSELATRRRLWEEKAAELTPAPAKPVPAIARTPRPAGLPPGPIETYAERAGVASAAALGGTWLATQSVRRGMAAMLSCTPKGALLGREAFAAHLGRALARRQVLCLDTEVLRRLDRVDTIVIDGRLFHDRETIVEGVRALPGTSPDARALVDAARHAGLHVVVADPDSRLAARVGADGHIDCRDGIASGLRRLQADGAGILAVTSDRDALLSADCGIDLIGSDGVSWEAELVCANVLDVCFVVEAVAVAHKVSRESVALALAASSLGVGFSLLSTPVQAARSAVGAVNGGALLAMLNGIRIAAGLDRRATLLDPPPARWHELDVDHVLASLDSSTDGLTANAAMARRMPRLDHARGISLPAAVLEELVNPMTPVLVGATAVSGAAGSVVDASLVASVVAGNGGLGGLQRYRVERAVQALERVSETPVWTRRDGQWCAQAVDGLVVGDVIRLQAGDWVPADCRILVAKALEVEQAGLTGESAPVPRDAAPCVAPALAERSSMLYEGSSIAAGRVEAVVVATAPDTEVRRAAVGVAPPPSGVETRLRDLTRITVPLAIAGGGTLLATSLLRGLPLRDSVYSGISLAVAAVPEGLPLLSTMAQLSAAHRLSARGALVRNPRALEALGRVEVLCCDKTGTLTEGHISLQAVHDGDELRDLEDLRATHRTVLAAALRASPRMHAVGDVLPHLTDRAVVDGASRCGITADEGLHGWDKAAELPFEPARGYHAVLGRSDAHQILSVKGAPEIVLPRCERWRPTGAEQPLQPQERAWLADEVDRMARKGYRLLAVAERTVSGRADLDDDRVHRLTLLGFVALIDPVRPAAAAAVATLQQAGISVVMLTGDHPSTAEGVAETLGVLNGRRVVTGPELDALSDASLDSVLDDVGVFARVTPAHKTRLVGAYQRRRRAVAMTGDGANDAPAIRAADAGVAFGHQATPAARAAADVVVPDGRIETVVDAIVEGRALWASVRDAIAILVGGNAGEIAFTVLGSVVSRRPPLNPRQLLLVNLLTDIVPAIVIATRTPLVTPEELLAEGPETSLGRPLEQAIALRAVATTAGASLAWAGGRVTGRPARANTVGLVGLVGAQLGQTVTMAARNPAVLAASVGSAALLVGIVQTPGISHFFGCTPLGPVGWAIGAGAATAATVGAVLAPRTLHAIAGPHNTPPRG